VCTLCDALGYKGDETGETPVEDILHFLLECRVLDPVRDSFPVFFKPRVLPEPSKDAHMKYILNHGNHVMLVRCISRMNKHREACLELVKEGKIGEIMPAGYLPEDRNLWRLIAGGGNVMGDDFDFES
jgi:hypothetical protein